MWSEITHREFIHTSCSKRVRRADFDAESFIVYPKHRALAPLAYEFLELLRAARVETEKVDQPKRRAIQPNEEAKILSSRCPWVGDE